MMRRLAATLVAASLAAAPLAAPLAAASAQRGGGRGAPTSAAGRPRAGMQGGAAGSAPSGKPADRQMLERQVRQALARVTRKRLGLNDSQMAQLTDVDRNFQPRRQALTREEMQTRVALRAAMADTANPNQARIGGYLEHLADLQRQRIDLQQEEQKSLGTFLTPLQRAQYQALQERMRRRLEMMRPAGGGAGVRAGKPPDGGPPGAPPSR